VRDARAWAVERAREGGEDFATTLPGGELDGLYSVVTVAEALKLAARAFAYMARTPEALGEIERAPHPTEVDADPGAPRPSLLPFRRIRAVPEAGVDGGGERAGGRADTERDPPS
jgi:hypothetical protein